MELGMNLLQLAEKIFKIFSRVGKIAKSNY